MATFLSQVINGLNQASILLIATMGLVIIFGYMNVTNMAHGSMIMVGGVSAYVLMEVVGLPFGVAIAGAFLITALIGMLIEKVIIKKLYSKPTETILATYAVSLILTELVRLKYPLSQNVHMPLPGAFRIGSVTIPYYNIFVGIFAILILVFTLFLFRKTTFGKKLGSVTQNRTMTECLGIKTASVDTLTFGYGAGLAGVAGCILAPTTGVSYDMGSTYLTDTFMTNVVGGVQSFFGTAVSSFIIGEGRTVTAGFLNETWAKIIIFMIVIVLIRFKPEGLFTKERR
ncbi:MAG: urea ABC transporter permease subunit UrtB [Oscillospiraceae bacterium]|nr:urea ABC transporter permease subunit UrtB [Oscillospiraceae bacterium]MCI7499270.1 urea ABC transporter permease subunit UrtB [Oscillospiraceae bacterium]MDD7278527.1 urea ABC transporter permease subunit UrtB [Oscillospiraceae bacterium]MDY2863704.1 urea ABC transporter permease subunit UrtB [Oscillospiraceae bacterium]